LRAKEDQLPVQLVNTEIAASDLHVLVVEDNLVNQRVLAKQLRKIGINVTVANHGGEALDHLLTTTYCAADKAGANRLSLILMDWEMPVGSSRALAVQAKLTTTQVMDGLTCVQRIRELEQQNVVRGHVPVIAVTANVRAEQVGIAMKAGMDNVISKPFRIPELFACMQKTLQSVAQM
jgi:CheY-like chemotaxis protein